MKRNVLLIVLVFLSLGLIAQEREDSASGREKSSRHGSGLFTGFSGGMMLHGGYLFSDDPTKVFSNTGLGSMEYVKGLPKSGICYGLGGTLRVHMLNFIHLGAEGFVSTMPLAVMGTGSNVRTAWGGAMCDVYANWRNVRPLVGLTVGGGSMKRLFVPDQAPVAEGTPGNETNYNASYVKTPFFLLDPYIGLEIELTNHIALLIRLDYMLPFGHTKSNLVQNVNWSNFMTPSGPRLYVGVMFGRLKR